MGRSGLHVDCTIMILLAVSLISTHPCNCDRLVATRDHHLASQHPEVDTVVNAFLSRASAADCFSIDFDTMNRLADKETVAASISSGPHGSCLPVCLLVVARAFV